MARGSFSGLIAGTVVSGVVAGVASVMSDLPGTAAPETTSIEVPAGSEFDQSRDDTQADLPEAQETPDGTDVVRVEPPAPDDLSSIDTAATQSASQPETGTADLALNAPKTAESGVGVSVDSDSPVQPVPQAEAPSAPAVEEELSISTEPAQPAQPDVPEEETAFSTEDTQQVSETAPAVGAETSTEEPVQAATDVAADPVDTADAPAAQTGDEDTAAEPDVATAETTTETAKTPQSESDEGVSRVVVQDEIETPQLPVIETPDTAPETTTQAAQESEEETVEVAEDAAPEPSEEEAGDVIAALPQSESSSSTIDDIAPNVTTDRLPSVSATPETPEEEPVTSEDATVEPPSDGDGQLPIKRFAAQFENPDNKPLMSIVLIDDGSSPIGLDALKSFPYPLNFAVDTGWPGAKDAMQKYRDAGFEVLAMIDLPEGQSATDTEVSMQTYLERVPQAVAVMEGDGSGLQAGREASEQLADILRDTGHGAVLFPNGLNTAQKLIAREGVPSASVFRDFDAKGQNATVIRRFLDQAAFRAGQEEKGVIMVGRLRADTISALLLWGLQDRAGRVAVAPVSAVLTAE